MKLLIALALLVTSHTAFSQTRIISVDAFDLAYSGGFLFGHDEGRGGRPDLNTTGFRLNLNYAQNYDPYVGLMWKGEFHWNHLETDFGSMDRQETTFGLAGGLVYNFQAFDMKNSFMAEALIGLERATYDYGEDESGLNAYFTLEGGKRFDLGKYAIANISYAPTISVTFKRYGGDIRDRLFTNGREVKINFLKFDILF